MFIGLMSDTHDNMISIKNAVSFFNTSNVKFVLHAGDIISPITLEYFKNLNMPFIAVFGNNDGDHLLWKTKIKDWGEIYERIFETNIDNKKILLMHEPLLLESLVRSQYYDYIIYGHTHKKDYRKIGNTVIINPGECGGWLTGLHSIALLETTTGNVQFIEI